MFLIVIYLILHIPFVWTDDKLTTTTESGEVCDLDSSCNASTNAETQTEKVNVTAKSKYNVTDRASFNDTLIGIFSFNGTNATIGETDNKSKINQTEMPKESKPLNTKYQMSFDDGCSCDVTRGSCDINCCCDRECQHVNRDVFKNCMAHKHHEEDKFCPSKILNSPLLCIVKDNLYSRHFYPKHQVAEETSSVDKLLKNREVFGWSFPTLPPEDEKIAQIFEQYEISSPLWIYKINFEIIPFRLPKSTILSRDCSHKEAMRFLENFEEVCVHRIKNVSASECENNHSVFNAVNYFSNFSFIANPALINSTEPNCTENCVNITTFICENDDLASCIKVNASAKLKPNFSLKTNICSQAVTAVHYVIFHNGTEGISAVHVYLQQTDITFYANLLWALSFKLSYTWVGQENAFELSGHPGYMVEKPIITGYKSFQYLKENKTVEKMEMSFNHNHWLTVFRTKPDGSCWKTHRENIRFQENLYAHCVLNVPTLKNAENCDSFQKEILETMFGLSINLSNAFVSTTGDPDVADKKKWARILVDFPSAVFNETCHGIITDVKMVVLHSIVGEHDNPRQVIMGVKISGRPFYRNVLKYKKLKISFAVNFYDVTNPPLRIFAEPPTYEVKLPTDFFYPFFSAGVVPKCSSVLSVLIFIHYKIR